MNRLEQIIEASKVNLEKREDEILHVYDRHAGFIEGAEWADNTMIEKACAWLEDNYPYYFDTDIEKQFKKAMKGDEEDD